MLAYLLLLCELVTGFQAALSMCDVGVQRDLLRPFPPMTSTPKNGDRW